MVYLLFSQKQSNLPLQRGIQNPLQYLSSLFFSKQAAPYMFGRVLNTTLHWWIFTNFSNIFRIPISPNVSGRLFVQVTHELYLWRQPISTTVCTWLTSCVTKAITLHKKGSFPLRISSLNVAITEETFNGNFFSCAVSL